MRGIANRLYQVLVLTVVLTLSACASTPDEDTNQQEEILFPELRNKRPYERDQAPPEIIDYDGLQKSLGLSRGLSEYGYLEKDFATCDVGYGYSSTHRCRKNIFVVIQIQLLCRDSEGTVSTTLRYDDMKPLTNRTIKWEMAGDRGSVVLDGQGRGQIRSIFASSPREKRLKVSTQNDFLYMQAGSIRRVVTPQSWCK
jgi:hypothetical protein